MKLNKRDDRIKKDITTTVAHLKDSDTHHDIQILDIHGSHKVETPASYYFISGSGQLVTDDRIETLEAGDLAHSTPEHTIEGECRIVQFTTKQ